MCLSCLSFFYFFLLLWGPLLHSFHIRDPHRAIKRPFASWTTHKLCPSSSLASFSFKQIELEKGKDGGDYWDATMTCLGASLRKDRDNGITHTNITQQTINELENSLNQWKLEMLWYLEANQSTHLVHFPHATHCYSGFEIHWSPTITLNYELDKGMTKEVEMKCIWDQGKFLNEPYHNLFVSCTVPLEGSIGHAQTISVTLRDPGINLSAQVQFCQLEPQRTIDKFSFCSAPMFHVDRMEAKWPGIVEQWVLYHHQLLGLGKMYLYDIDGSLEKYVQRVAALGYVEYVKKFAVSEDCRKKAEEEGYVYCSQVHAENHCIWRTRGLSEYTIKIHNVDAYVKDNMNDELVALTEVLDNFFFDSRQHFGSFVGLLGEIYDRTEIEVLLNSGKLSPSAAYGEGGSSDALSIFAKFLHPIDAMTFPPEAIVDPHLSIVVFVHKPMFYPLFSGSSIMDVATQHTFMHFVSLFHQRFQEGIAALLPSSPMYVKNFSYRINDSIILSEIIPNLMSIKQKFETLWKEYEVSEQSQLKV